MADRKHGEATPQTTSTIRAEDWPGHGLDGLDPLTTGLRGAIIDPYQSVVIVTSLGLEVRDD
jgi:hypothetical protein